LVIAKIEEFGFGGIVAKRKYSLYVPGKSPGTWVKMKLKQSDEFLVGGYLPGSRGIDQLVNGRFDGKDFKCIESLDDGFGPATRSTTQSNGLRYQSLHLRICPRSAALTGWTARRWKRSRVLSPKSWPKSLSTNGRQTDT
jgi:bifunctional non-homologous end joining protein LigD